ncbi:hypothetical protein ACQ4PT_054030 [Festuca glaucescens]
MVVKRDADVLASSRPQKTVRIILRARLPRYLPDAMIFNILSRLPSKSILRCKSVCKAWHAMISDCHFISHHLKLSKTHPRMLVLPCSYFREPEGVLNRIREIALLAFSLDFYEFGGGNVRERIYRQVLPKGIARCTRPLQCDGLFLISTLNQEIMVCNPATKEFVTLPKGSHNLKEHQRVGFGFDPSSGKILLPSTRWSNSTGLHVRGAHAGYL